MEMPTPCNECNETVELNDMVSTSGKLCYNAMVCQDCFDNLESDED